MKKIFGMLIITALISTSSFALQGLLEKDVFWVEDSTTIETAKYWAIYLGDYDVSLKRKLMGEDEQIISGTMNLNMYSSGYIKGTGYSTKGKIECTAELFANDKKLTFEDIVFVFDYGRRVKLSDGTEADLGVNIEGSVVPLKKLHMRKYIMTDGELGEKTLKEVNSSEDLMIENFFFSREIIKKQFEGKNFVESADVKALDKKPVAGKTKKKSAAQ